MKVTALLMLTIFSVYLVTGMMLAILPPYLSIRLHQSNFVIGLVSGLQFATALATRIWAGKHTDHHGPKSSLMIALAFTFASGAMSFSSLLATQTPLFAVTILAFGRALLGAAECFVIVGSVSWSMALMGRKAAGKAIAQMGTALYIGLAAGAPAGSFLYSLFGFPAAIWATFALALIAFLAIAPLRAVHPETRPEGTIFDVVKAVWKPGLGLSFASFGYGATITFAILLFNQRHWQPSWLAFTIFAVSFILARIILGHLPDKIGGAKVAQIFAIMQTVGLATLALSPWFILGLAGSALSGFGYSLVYPGLGQEAVLRTPAANQGAAVAVYTGFLELTLGIATPLLGLLANNWGLGSVFLVSAISALGAVAIGRYLTAHPAV